MTTKKKEPITPEDACRMMHVAIRKCCDSKATSAMYNVIGIVCALEIKPRSLDPWIVFGRLVADTYNAPEVGAIGTADIKECAERLDDEWWKALQKRKGKGHDEPDYARSALYALTSVFRLFDAKDWEGMASYLVDED